MRNSNRSLAWEQVMEPSPRYYPRLPRKYPEQDLEVHYLSKGRQGQNVLNLLALLV